MYDERTFSKGVERRWGDILPFIKDEGVHFQMGCLANGIKNAFAAGDARLGREILAFVEDALMRAGFYSEIENAVAISFLEPDDIERLGIAKEVPENIRRVLDEQKRRWESAT